jgi:hypothetical protein
MYFFLTSFETEWAMDYLVWKNRQSSPVFLHPYLSSDVRVNPHGIDAGQKLENVLTGN